MNHEASIGVFGGSGFYSFLNNVEYVEIDTPYGKPSDKIAITKVGNNNIAFLPRHGSKHQFSPHKINYRANLWAMKTLGVKKIIGPCAAGSLKKEIKPGDFVICDDIVNMSIGRTDTFYEEDKVVHVSMFDTYCPDLRKAAIQAVKTNNIFCHENGTVVVIQGPRFASKSESKSYIQHGWDVINMTQYPESYLAKELDICYVNISLITDYDIGVEGIKPSDVNEIFQTFKQNNEKVKDVLFTLIENISIEQENCNCKNTSTLSAIN